MPPKAARNLRKERPAGSPSRHGLAFVELASEDLSLTQKFLSRVFGWKFQSVRMPMGEYLTFRTGDGGQGGVRPTKGSEAPSSLGYVRVRDLDDARKRVERAGGRIILPRIDVPGMGSFFWFQVPSGPVMACWQDEPRNGRRRS